MTTWLRPWPLVAAALLALLPVLRAKDQSSSSSSLICDADRVDAGHVSLYGDWSPRPEHNFLSYVTMYECPSGSLTSKYDGVQGLIVRQIYGEYRRFVRKSVRRGWCIADDNDVGRNRDLYRLIDRAHHGSYTNGAWWLRQWWESLSPERGGAPPVYTETYGKEIAWRLGPATITNTLKLRFDYLGLFEVEPDPVSTDYGQPVPPIAIDLSPPNADGEMRSVRGPEFKFDVRPRLRVGLPNPTKGVVGVVRSAAIQVVMSVLYRERRVIRGEVDISWSEDNGLSGSFEITLARW